MDFSNVNTDAKGYAVPLASTVELEDVHKAPVEPVPEDGEADTVDLDDKALHGKKQGGGNKEKGDWEETEGLEDNNKQDIFSQAELEKAVEEIRKHFEAMASSFTIDLYMDADLDYRAELKDMKTNEVIRKITAEEIIRLRKKILDMTGLLFDKEV